MSTKPELRELIRSGKFIVAPGVFDMISARVADRVGFEEVWAFEKRWGLS
jgi:2-methylisocitrate lyase-like PEP mutase family enzyme